MHSILKELTDRQGGKLVNNYKVGSAVNIYVNEMTMKKSWEW